MFIAVGLSLLGFGKFVLSAVFNTFIIFVLTLYFLASLPHIKRAGYGLAPASRRVRVSKLGDQILAHIGRYVAGALLGVVGALIAIPTAAAILLIVKEVVIRRQDLI